MIDHDLPIWHHKNSHLNSSLSRNDTFLSWLLDTPSGRPHWPHPKWWNGGVVCRVHAYMFGLTCAPTAYEASIRPAHVPYPGQLPIYFVDIFYKIRRKLFEHENYLSWFWDFVLKFGRFLGFWVQCSRHAFYLHTRSTRGNYPGVYGLVFTGDYKWKELHNKVFVPIPLVTVMIRLIC